jgi:hypothetical protein
MKPSFVSKIGNVTATVTWHNAGPHTIWAKLAERLGREPTNAEATAEVKRILAEGRAEREKTHGR